MGEVVEKFGIGIAVDIYEKLAEEITKFVNSFDSKEFIKSCDEFLSIAQKEQQVYIRKIYDFVKENN